MDPLGFSRQAHYWSCDGGQGSKFLRQLSAKKGKEKKNEENQVQGKRVGCFSTEKFNILSNLKSLQFSRS